MRVLRVRAQTTERGLELISVTIEKEGMMLTQSRLIRDTRLIFVGSVILLIALGIAFVSSGWATQSTEVNDRVDMPPFRMVRQSTTEGGMATFELVWEGQDSWRETLISSDAKIPDGISNPDVFRGVGRYTEVGDGKVVHFEFGLRSERDAGSNIQVPGPWFADLDWLAGRYRDDKVTDDGLEIRVEATNRLGTTVWVLDKTTGIPLRYQEIVGGSVVVDSQAVSVVLLSGEVIR